LIGNQLEEDKDEEEAHCFLKLLLQLIIALLKCKRRLRINLPTLLAAPTRFVEQEKGE
jgi:hypothetical protein